MQILNIPIYFSYRAKSPNNGGQGSAWHAPRDSGHDFSLPGPSWHPGIEGITNLQWLPSSFFQCRKKSSLGVMRIRILDPHHSIFSLFLKLVIFSKKDRNCATGTWMPSCDPSAARPSCGEEFASAGLWPSAPSGPASISWRGSLSSSPSRDLYD